MTDAQFQEIMRSLLPERGNLRQHILCKDGFAMSVQAGLHHKSLPEGDHQEYTHWEVGYPSQGEEVLLPFRAKNSQFSDATRSVYYRVPSEVMIELIEKHGGFSRACMRDPFYGVAP